MKDMRAPFGAGMEKPAKRRVAPKAHPYCEHIAVGVISPCGRFLGNSNPIGVETISIRKEKQEIQTDPLPRRLDRRHLIGGRRRSQVERLERQIFRNLDARPLRF